MVCVGFSLLASGCYSTRAVHGDEISRLKRGPQVLRAVEGTPVRIDPNSRVRFWRTDGSRTGWIKASELEVADDGVFIKRRNGVDGLQWSDVAHAEVNNLSGPYTLLVVGASVGIVLLAVAAAKGGGGNVDCSGLNCSGIGPVSSPGHYGGGPGVPAVPEAHSVGMDQARRSRKHAHGARLSGGGLPPQRESHALFNEDQSRRARMRILASADFGGASGNGRPDVLMQSAFLGVRFSDMFELGGGIRRQMANPTAGDQVEVDTGVYPYGRMGLHMQLDPRGYVAVPAFVDVGLAPGKTYQIRFGYGLRVRLNEHLYIGMYPFNPMVQTAGPTGSARLWFPSTFELGGTF